LTNEMRAKGKAIFQLTLYSHLFAKLIEQRDCPVCLYTFTAPIAIRFPRFSCSGIASRQHSFVETKRTDFGRIGGFIPSKASERKEMICKSREDAVER
jgi:hypothetical protein